MIKYEQKENIGIIYLNRPEKRNSLHPEMISQIKQKLHEIEIDSSIKALIITGEGSSFCAGADLEYLNQLSKNSLIENEIDSENLAEFFVQLYNFPKPTIAAVNGPAIAGGCGLASVCDFIVAHPAQSKFGYSEVKIGFIPAIVSIFLMKKIGEGKASQMMLSGDLISGQKAFELGLVYQLTENVFDESLVLAKTISQNPEWSYLNTKKMIRDISGMNINEAVEYCKKLNVISRTTNDFKNGIEKFLNKNKREL
jgi:methylglutaconyl-CoA hydratase